MDRFQSQSDRFPKRKRKTGDCRLGSGEFGGAGRGESAFGTPLKKAKLGQNAVCSFSPFILFRLIVCGSCVDRMSLAFYFQL